MNTMKSRRRKRKNLNLRNKMKICTNCGIEQCLDEFHVHKGHKDGKQSHCKSCRKYTAQQWFKNNREHIKEVKKEWYRNNPEKIAKQGKLWRENNSEKIRQYRKENAEKIAKEQKRWNNEHPEIIIAAGKKWKENNLERAREVGCRCQHKYRSTIRGKLNNKMNASIGRVLKGKKMGDHWERLVGYTVDNLKKHLEKQFKEGMNWGNYGRGKDKWQIDHIVPISVFNFFKPEHPDFHKCWNLNNLQPMWSQENQSKSNKLTKSFQPCLAF